jgi:predicted GNAT family acetyltransferase
MDVTVIHNGAARRFESLVDGQLSVADYELSGGVMHLTHTWVPKALQGRGIAAHLVRAALDHAKAQGLKVHPVCSYVRLYMERHPDVHELWER